MAPLALAQMMAASFMMGEMHVIWNKYEDLSRSFAWPLVLSSGFTAFSLNVLSLVANRSTSPLTLSVAANVKQVKTTHLMDGWMAHTEPLVCVQMCPGDDGVPILLALRNNPE